MTDMMISTPQRDLMVTKAVRMPVIYEEAVRDLIACQTLDEAHYFADKAEALAAWAKIYRNDQAGIEAKRLKLHAYRRMGEIARELRPITTAQPVVGDDGRLKFAGRKAGPQSLLKNHGLSHAKTESALRLSRMEKETFDAYVASPRPPGVTTIGTMRKGVSREFQLFMSTCNSTRAQFRKKSAAEFLPEIPLSDGPNVRALCVELIDWLDDLERRLPPDDEAPLDSRSRSGSRDDHR